MKEIIIGGVLLGLWLLLWMGIKWAWKNKYRESEGASIGAIILAVWVFGFFLLIVTFFVIKEILLK